MASLHLPRAVSMSLLLLWTAVPLMSVADESVAEPGWVEPNGPVRGLGFYMRAALSNARRIAVARANSDAAESATTGALGGLLPRLSARAAYTRNQFEARGLSVDEVTGETSTVVLLPGNQWDLDASATLPLIDGTRWSRYAGARAARAAARGRLAVVEADVSLDVARFYLTALATQEKLRSARRSLKAAQADVAHVQARRNIGGATSLTLARAQLEQQRARQRVLEQKRTLLAQLRRLATLCGTEQPRIVAPVTVDMTLPPAVDYGRVKRRAELREADAQRRDAVAAAREAYWRLAPALQAVATEHYGNTYGFAGKRAWYTLLLQLQLDMDLTRLGQAGESSALADAAAARFAQTKDQLEQELYLARLDVITGIETVKTAREAERVAVQAAEAARAQFRLGAGTQRDVIEGERDRVAAEADRAEVEADLTLARLRLLRACGESVLWRDTSGITNDDG